MQSSSKKKKEKKRKNEKKKKSSEIISISICFFVICLKENQNAEDEVPDVRANNFVERALSEITRLVHWLLKMLAIEMGFCPFSHFRMRKETDKSHQKLADLHAELGAENFTEWRAEHSSEVLTQQESSAVENAAQLTDQLW